MRLYVHGAGRTGAEAWPHAARIDAQFTDLSSKASANDQAAMLSQMAPSPCSTVIAHSFGAIPVLLAIRAGTLVPEHLILLEPALYDIALGHESIERHINTMTCARNRADEGDMMGYWRIVRPLMFGGPFDPELWAVEKHRAQRFYDHQPPWGHGLTAQSIEGIHTLVLTGGWNAEYESIAAILSLHGGEHEQLRGNRHRVQDHPAFEAIVSSFASSR